LWVSEISSHPWGIWGIYGVSSAYGKIFYPQYDGLVAYNWDDGTIEWRYQSIAEYPFETVYSDGNNPFYQSIVRIADGVIYVANDEHSVSNPITRGWKLHAVNATDGTGIWNITGSMASGAVADGYLTATNRDGYLYVFGKGKSATTVSVPQTEISSGTQVIISGTVMDMSPAQPNTACVSKDTMGPWMEYLHMQKTMPSGTGVPVSIDAVDPNGNAIHIADVTSDLSGTYAYTWAPDITGEYAITATFVGDDSYGSSWAETHAVVTEATETPPTQTPVNFDAVNSTVTTVVLGGVVAIIIAVALAAVLILRKKP
jgi:hypothetical protein